MLSNSAFTQLSAALEALCAHPKSKKKLAAVASVSLVFHFNKCCSKAALVNLNLCFYTAHALRIFISSWIPNFMLICLVFDQASSINNAAAGYAFRHWSSALPELYLRLFGVIWLVGESKINHNNKRAHEQQFFLVLLRSCLLQRAQVPTDCVWVRAKESESTWQ